MTHRSIIEAAQRLAEQGAAMGEFAKSLAPPRLPDIRSLTPPRFELSDLPVIEPPDPPAVYAFNTLVEEIRSFEAELDDEHEIGATFVSDGSGMVFHVGGVGYREPDIMIFWGATADRQPVRLLQHVSQLNVRLTALPKQQEKPRRIGFALGMEE